MRYCMLTCCLVGMLSWGCSKSSEPRAVRGDIPVNLNGSEKPARRQPTLGALIARRHRQPTTALVPKCATALSP